MSFSTLDAIFVGTVLEGFAYGIYAVVFALYLDATRRNSNLNFSSSKSILHYALCFLFFLATFYFAFDFTQQFFTIMRNEGDGGLAWGINIALSAVFPIIDCLSQMILIYRCWVIWGRNPYIVVLPIILSLTSLSSSLALDAGIGTRGTDNRSALPGWFLPLGTAGYSISLAVNALVTAIIVGRIWMIIRETRQELSTNDTGYLHPIISMLIESGMLMLAAQLTWVVVFKLKSPSWYMLGGPIAMINGITPTLVAVRVVLGKTYETRLTGEANTDMAFAPVRYVANTMTSATLSNNDIRIDKSAVTLIREV